MKRPVASLLLSALVACTGSAAPPVARTSSTKPRPTAVPSTLAGDFVFAVKGDWGAGTSEQQAITKQMCAWRARTHFQYVLTVGDNFYNPDGVATANNFYRPEACLIGNITWRAARGNHDVAGSSTDTVLGARDPWYAWSSHGVDFFVLDTNLEQSSAQTTWLAANLKASRARVKIVYFHAPPFTVGSVHLPDANVRRNWVPLFERYHVTLVMSGHEHDYEHFVVNNINYVITGGGGAVLYGCVRSVPHLKRCRTRFEFLLVDVGERSLTVNAVGTDGRPVDSFTIAL